MSDRKVVLKMVMSLDGFATSPDGTHEWMFEWFGDDSGEWNRRALEEAGVHAMGRRSYEIMGPYWAASDGPIATAMNEKPKLSSPAPWRRRNGDRPRSSAGTWARRSRT
jgi:dihydrofolate reductase